MGRKDDERWIALNNRLRQGSATTDDPVFVICPECGNEQGDMGKGVCCEECGHAPMPTGGDKAGK